MGVNSYTCCTAVLLQLQKDLQDPWSMTELIGPNSDTYKDSCWAGLTLTLHAA